MTTFTTPYIQRYPYNLFSTTFTKQELDQASLVLQLPAAGAIQRTRPGVRDTPQIKHTGQLRDGKSGTTALLLNDVTSVDDAEEMEFLRRADERIHFC